MNHRPNDFDPAMLLQTGAMTGPHRRTKPLTVPWWVRLLRWADAKMIARKTERI